MLTQNLLYCCFYLFDAAKVFVSLIIQFKISYFFVYWKGVSANYKDFLDAPISAFRFRVQFAPIFLAFTM